MIAICASTIISPGPAAAQVEDVPAEVVELPPRDSFALKVGFLNSWLFDSNQGRPFIYLDFGLRLKTDEFYIDAKLPAIVAGLDFVVFHLQRAFGVRSPFNLFEALNQPIQYGAYLEPANLKLGQTFLLELGPTTPLRLTLGIFTLLDFVFFELALVQRAPEDFKTIDDPDANDPFVVGVGGFVSIGGNAPLSEWDLAIGTGPDIYQNPGYVTNRGFVIFGDLDLQIDPLRDVGAYIRARLSTYTHTQPIVWTMVLSYGVALKLL